MIECRWNPITDPDEPTASIRCRIEYSRNGGVAWSNVPGLVGGLTAPGAVTHTVDMSLIPLGGPFSFRFTGWDGWLFGASTVVPVTFSPAITTFSTVPPGMAHEGDLVTLGATVVDRDSDPSSIKVEFWYSWSGLLEDAKVVGQGTLGGPNEFNWTPTPLPNGYKGSRGNGKMYVRGMDEVGWGPYSSFAFELNTFPRPNNLEFTQKANTLRAYSITFTDDNDIISVQRDQSRSPHVVMDETFAAPDYATIAFFSVDANEMEIGLHTFRYRVDGDPRGPHYFTAKLEILPPDPEPSNIFHRHYVPQHHPGAIR